MLRRVPLGLCYAEVLPCSPLALQPAIHAALVLETAIRRHLTAGTDPQDPTGSLAGDSGPTG